MHTYCPMLSDTFSQALLDFLANSPTPYHAVDCLIDILRKNGFTKLNETDTERELSEGSYFLTCDGTSLAAFVLPENKAEQTGMRIGCAHTDSPLLKLKPRPLRCQYNCIQLTAEVYGGALLSPWFDRDLGLAGRIFWQDANGRFFTTLVRTGQPVAFLPSLAIHLDRDANKGRAIDRQKELVPLAGLEISLTENDLTGLFRNLIREQVPDAQPDRILGHDLFFHDAAGPALIGMNREFLSGQMLDNLLSCFCLIHGLISARNPAPALVLLTANEEVGSVTPCGARGAWINNLLQTLLPQPRRMHRAMARSLLVSVDNAHGVHPNHADRHDPEHRPLLGDGVVIKWNANQRYTTDAVSGGLFRALCQRRNIGCQDFVMRNDLACGSTIGPHLAADFGLRGVDIGVPTLAMHSIRELAAIHDCEDLAVVLGDFFSLDPHDPLWNRHGS